MTPFLATFALVKGKMCGRSVNSTLAPALARAMPTTPVKPYRLASGFEELSAASAVSTDNLECFLRPSIVLFASWDAFYVRSRMAGRVQTTCKIHRNQLRELAEVFSRV